MLSQPSLPAAAATQGEVPAGAPETTAALAALSDRAVSGLLAAYRLSTRGEPRAKRRRLAAHLCVALCALG